MKRSDFLKKSVLGTTGVISGAAFLGSGCQEPQNDTSAANIISKPKKTWKMATVWPINFPVLGEAANLLSKWVGEMSDNQLQIKVFGNGELSERNNIFEVTASGQVEMGMGTTTYWHKKNPAFYIFGSLPFGMNAQMQQSWMLGGKAEGLQFWRELFSQHGLVPFLGGNTGAQMFGWSNKSIETMDDFKGLKVRLNGLSAKVLEKHGAFAKKVHPSKICKAIEKGEIDLAEWVGPYQDYNLNLHKYAKYYYTPGWNEPSGQLAICCNEKAFGDLPETHKHILETATMRVQSWMLAECDARNLDYLSLISASGTQLKSLPPAMLRELKKTTLEVLQAELSTDPFAQKVYESFAQYQKERKDWNMLLGDSWYSDLSQL